MRKKLRRMLLLAALFVLPLAMNAQSGVYFTENFEAASTTWTQTGTHWQLSTANSYGFGTRCFNMPHSSRGATDTLISPVIDLSTATNPQLSFYHIQKEWAGDQDELHVLYRTSATGAWTSLAAFTSDVQAWTEEIIALTGVTSSTVQLGFAGVDNYGHGLFLDSIVVSESPSCPSINGIIVNGATVASASLSWTVSAAPATVPGGYSVVYSVNGDTSSEMTMTATTNSMVLTGLTPGTAYKVVVTPDCGTDGLGRGDTTYLTTTALTCMEIDTANSLIVGAMDNSHGNTTAYFPNYTYYNYSYAQQLYTPADIIGEGDSISGMTIEVASGSATRNIKVYLANAPAAASLASGLIAFDSATFVNVFSGSVTFEEGTVAVPFSQNFYYNGTGNIVLTVIDVTGAWTQSPSRYYTPSANIMARIVYSDTYNYDGGQNTANGTMQTLNGRANVVLQKSVCAQLSYCANPIVTVDTTEENSIAVSWTAGYQEDNWDVNYRVQGTEAWTLAEHTTNLASTIGNLTSNTIYEIQIMTPCGDNTVVTAITRCGSIARSAMPVTETFESYSDRDTIRCWNILGNVAATSYDAVYPHASASAGHSSGFGLDIMYNVDDARGNEVGAVFPQFEVGIDSIDVTFDAKANYSGHYDPITFEYVYDTVPGQLLFGVCDDRMGTNFVVLDTFNLTNRWGTYTFSTNAHQDDLGDAMYVGFKSMTSDSTGSDHISMDNVVFEIHSNCLSPVAISIDSSTFTYFNVDVTYTEDPMTEASEYEMKVGRVNDINNADTTFAVLGSPVALTNIVAETDYYVWMRSVCGDLGGRWFGPFHFRTPAACSAVENLQYFYNQTSNSVSLSWNTSRLGNPINGFVVRYRCDDTAVTRVYTSDSLVTLSGLQELASYEVTVASICGDDTSAAQRVEFNTGKCNVVAIGQMGTSYVPTYTYYNYSYAQEIYLASEMTSLDDTIRGVAFFNGSANAPSGRNITVYMGQTDQNTFGGTTGIVSDSLTVVYTDSVHTWNTGWDTITFTTPFVRNNSRNIVFAIDDNTGAYVASPIWLSQYSVGNGRVLYKFNDSSNPNPASPTGMTAGDYIPTAQFIANCVTPACVAPSVFATNASQNTVSLRWVAGGAETSWNVDYRISGTTAWNSAATAVTTTAYQVTGLTASNNYEFRVSSQCGAESAATIVNAHTTCGLIAVPYRQNFEGLATGDFAINCWNAISSTYMMWGYEQTAYPYIENVPSFSNMVRLYHNTAVVLPATAAAVNQLQVRFLYKGVNGNHMIVGVTSTPATLDSILWADTLDIPAGEEAQYYTVRFDASNVTSGNIFFKGISMNDYEFIDNIIVDSVSSCYEVEGITLTSSTSTSADIAWNSTGAGSYIVEYGTAGFSLGTGTRVTVTTNSCTFSGLATAVSYDVYVYGVCTGNDTSYASNRFTFTTECVALTTLPYVENFDNVANLTTTTSYTDALPACWTSELLSTGASGSYRPQIYRNDTWSTYSSSGDYSLLLYYNGIAVLPEMGMGLDTLTISFNAKRGYEDYQIAIGVVDSSTPGCVASFVGLDTITVPGYDNYYDDRWTVTTFLNGYTGNSRYIAIQSLGSSSIYIDDVVVDYLPVCWHATDLAYTAVATSASVDWTDVLPASSYIVEYDTAGFTEGTGTIQAVSTHPFNISGLTALSAYDVYVTTLCANGDTMESQMITIHTDLCDDVTYATTADSVNAGATENWLSCYYGYSGNQTIITAAEMAANGIAAGVPLGYLGIEVAEASDAVGMYDSTYIYIANTTRTGFASNSDFDTVDGTYTHVWHGRMPFDQTGWAYIALDTAFVWDGTSNVIIAVERFMDDWENSNAYVAYSQNDADTINRTIFYYNDGGPVNFTNPTAPSYGSDVDTWRANLRLAICGGMCPIPTVSMTSHDYESATFTWSGSATSYEVAVKAMAVAEWPAAVTVNTNTYAAAGLAPSTNYMARVRAICDENSTSDWGTLAFTTDSLPCMAPTGLHATQRLGDAELTWTPGTTEQNWNIHVWNTTFDSVYAVSSNPATVGGLTPGATYNAAVAASCGNAGLVVSDYGDTISFTTDICQEPTNVAVSSITGSSAKVSWTAGGNNTGKWIVEYGMEGYTSGNGTQITATATETTVTGLEPEMTYDVYVRAMCEDQYPSNWSAKASFTTVSGEGIDNADASRVSIFPNPADDNATVNVSGVEGMVTITVVDMNGRAVNSETMECSADCVKTFNVESIASGAYFVRIQGNGINVVKKLIVK